MICIGRRRRRAEDGHKDSKALRLHEEYVMNNHKNITSPTQFFYLFFRAIFCDVTNVIKKLIMKPYCVFINNPESLKEFLNSEGICLDGFWAPNKKNIVEFKSSFKQYLNNNKVIVSKMGVDRNFILSNFSKYNFEYAGFFKDRIQYMFCYMNLCSHHKPSDEFSWICDGGSGVLQVIYNVKEKTIFRIECNGSA
jgi:hypothetical protein